MVDSNTVLHGQTFIYTFYALAIILMVGWFAYRVTTDGPSKVKPAFFYTFVGFLITLGEVVCLFLSSYFVQNWGRGHLSF